MEENGRQVSFIFRGTEETKEDRIRYIRTNELLASDAESARTYYHYASDEIGNITHVVEDNHVLNHYEYDVWGKLTVCEETIDKIRMYNDYTVTLKVDSMIIQRNIITNLEINSLEHLYKLKPLTENFSLNINKSQIAREVDVDRRTVDTKG